MALSPLSRGTAWIVGEQLLRAAANAVLAFWAALLLGPAAWGDWSSAMAVGVLALVLSQLGLDIPLVLHLAGRRRGRGDAGVVLRHAAALRAGAAAVLAIPGLALAWFGLSADGGFASALMLLAAVMAAPAVAEAVYKGFGLLERLARLRLAATVIGFVAKASVLAAGGGAVALAGAALGEAALLSSLLWVGCAGPRAGTARVRLKPRLLRVLLKLGLPVLLPASAAALALRLELLVVAAWLGPTAAGHYALAQRVLELLLLVPIIGVDLHAAPRLTTEPPQRTYDQLAAAAWAVAAAGSLLGPWLVRQWLGPHWHSSADLLRTMAWSAVPLVLLQVRLIDERRRGSMPLMLRVAARHLLAGTAACIAAVHLGGSAAAAVAGVAVLWWLVWVPKDTGVPVSPAHCARRALWPWSRLLRSRRVEPTAP